MEEDLIPMYDPEREKFSAGLRKSLPYWFEEDSRRRRRAWTTAALVAVGFAAYVAIGISLGWSVWR